MKESFCCYNTKNLFKKDLSMLNPIGEQLDAIEYCKLSLEVILNDEQI